MKPLLYAFLLACFAVTVQVLLSKTTSMTFPKARFFLGTACALSILSFWTDLHVGVAIMFAAISALGLYAAIKKSVFYSVPLCVFGIIYVLWFAMLELITA